MANYSLNDIKEIRELTGAGMADVKNALVEAEGDKNKAVEIIRIKGLKGVAKRADREATEGLVAAKTVNNDSAGYVVEINCETDFVAKSPKFIEFGDKVLDAIVATDAKDAETALKAPLDGSTVDEELTQLAATLGEKLVLRRASKIEGELVTLYLHRTQKDLPPAIAAFVATNKAAEPVARGIAQHIAAYSPKYLSREQVPADLVEAEERVASETAKAEGKPENIVPNIVKGRLEGFYKENVLLDQPSASDPKKSVAKVLAEVNGELTDYLRIRVGN